jgi:hypothetical protein
MFGKIFVFLIIISASVNAYKNFTKQSISKDSEGGYEVKYSASEQLSNAIKADEQFKKSCKSLGIMRENQCLKNEKEFTDCLKIEELLLKEKFEIALYKCISKNTPQ